MAEYFVFVGQLYSAPVEANAASGFYFEPDTIEGVDDEAVRYDSFVECFQKSVLESFLFHVCLFV